MLCARRRDNRQSHISPPPPHVRVADANAVNRPTQVGRTRAEAQKGAAHVEAFAKDARDAALKKVDEFDKKVEAEASKAKSGFFSWFSSGNK